MALSYIQGHTPALVPHTIVRSSAAENELGWEWIIVGRVPGVSLTNALNDMDLEIKSTSAGVTKYHHFRRLDHHSLYPPPPPGAHRSPDVNTNPLPTINAGLHSSGIWGGAHLYEGTPAEVERKFSTSVHDAFPGTSWHAEFVLYNPERGYWSHMGLDERFIDV